MGDDDIGGVLPDERAAFRAVGGHLARRGLIHDTQGNLSTFDGRRLVITRTGCRLGALGEDDLLVGTASDPPAGASSDLDIHLRCYAGYQAADGVRSVVHAHPPGTEREGQADAHAGGAGGAERRHGVYGTGRTLEQAAAMVEMVVRPERAAKLGMQAVAGTIASPFSAVWFQPGGTTELEGDDGVVSESEVPASVSGFDQTRFPVEDGTGFTATSVDEVADAIRRLSVRGAPVLGIAAAFGVALAAFRARGSGEDVREAAAKAGALLVSTRPTAVNIRWAVDRLESAVLGAPDADVPARLLAEAVSIEREDAEACSAMGWFGEPLIPEGANVLTHCNTGMLCTAGIGTAFGVLWCSHLAGKGIHVWVDETRPLLQGARLTAWELQRLGVPFSVIADGAAGSLMARGRVDAVIVGADRIASNGDVANKVGTYPLAVLAARHEVPFYVAAPTSTVDPSTPSGDRIEIEERDPEEVTHAFGTRIAPVGAPALNPAFDVTPAELVTAIVTERGVVRAPYGQGLASLLGGAA
ncbi:MAG TPA: S-methyl-5-thioribose-1-phosphate isomerase [Actinomycetota bacterium]